MLIELRHHLDLHRMIGLNAAQLYEHGAAFWGHVRRMAEDDIALTICKIFENEEERRGYRRNSLQGITKDLPDGPFSEEIEFGVSQFCEAWGLVRKGSSVKDAFHLVRDKFVADNADVFRRLKYFRNKEIAHNEFEPGGSRPQFPSAAACEKIFEFSRDMRQSLASVFSGGTLTTALLTPSVGNAFMKLMGDLGVANPQRLFKD